MVDRYDETTGRIGFNIAGFGMRAENNPNRVMGCFFTVDFLEMVPELAGVLRDYAAREAADYAACYNDMAP